ncbi:MAG: pyridoxal-phosphate dependent enzyme [Saprospiraceae bacterium]|nr:pyridoxal-phosphate dependent enzyme [Saprospiraceae bacterium]
MIKLNLSIPSPIQKIHHPLLEGRAIDLQVKREDLIHRYISGNKWRKLKYNLLHAKKEGFRTIVTFGGAFSNHIFATAAACHAFKLNSIGIIRGEYDIHNPTLQFAQSCGMQLKFVDRSSYREKEKSPKVKAILKKLESYTLVPEGGTNALAYQGLKELAHEINETDVDVVLVSAGTGGTASGILKELDPSKELWVFSSLKGDFLNEEILSQVNNSKQDQFKFISTYHCGGYGKTPAYLVDFINAFGEETHIPLDPIYNGKLVYGFLDLAAKGKLDTSKSYLWVHTGGLQGIDAYNYMAEKKGKGEISGLSFLKNE